MEITIATPFIKPQIQLSHQLHNLSTPYHKIPLFHYLHNLPSKTPQIPLLHHLLILSTILSHKIPVLLPFLLSHQLQKTTFQLKMYIITIRIYPILLLLLFQATRKRLTNNSTKNSKVTVSSLTSSATSPNSFSLFSFPSLVFITPLPLLFLMNEVISSVPQQDANRPPPVATNPLSQISNTKKKNKPKFDIRKKKEN